MAVPTMTVDAWIESLIEKGLTGALSDWDFNKFLSEWKSVKISSTWMRYRKEVSWTPYTTEYMDSLAGLLKGSRVLQVYARNGLLAGHMQNRGVQWLPINRPDAEIRILEGACAVSPLPISEAIRTYNPDVIFGDWLPKGKTYDYDLTLYGKPMILVTEEYGGKSGSHQLWEYGAEGITGVPSEVNYSIVRLDSVDDFKDAPNWHGNSARTIMVLPRGSALITPKKAAFAGPPIVAPIY